MEKIYKITHFDLFFDCKIKIDEDKAKEPIKEMVEFWGGWERKLESNEGNYTLTFLKMLSMKIILLGLYQNLNLFGIKEEFKGLEGWAPMDGSQGITILEIDEAIIDYDNLHIEKLS
jgi:hypothetical protein